MDGSKVKKMLAVIGDIHGCITPLKELYYTLNDKYLIHRFIFLGDIVDRGNYSKEVTDFIIELQGKTLVTCLKGNHEDMLINLADNENRYDDFIWHERVGLNTVASFMGISTDEAVRKTHWEISPYFKPYSEFFRNFKEYHIEETKKNKFLFSHAGPAFHDLRPEDQYLKCSDEEKKRHYPFLWHTKTKSFQERYFDYILVHGHEAIVDKYSDKESLENVSPLIHKDTKGNLISVNIDTGCCYGGKLTAMIIDEDGKYIFESVKCDI